MDTLINCGLFVYAVVVRFPVLPLPFNSSRKPPLGLSLTWLPIRWTYFRDHPEMRDKTASILAWLAFKNARPCR